MKTDRALPKSGEPDFFLVAWCSTRRLLVHPSLISLKVCAGILLALSFASCAWAQVWERLGPDGGLVVSLGASPNGTLYLGTSDGHVFVRERDADSWELRGRVGPRMDAVVTRILPDPQNEQVAYAALWFQDPSAGGGVFRTEDGGRSWKLIGLAAEAVRALEMAPSHTDELIAGTRTGVFRSQNRGNSWQRISPADDLEIRNLDSVAVDPKDANIIYAGTYHLPWKTTDGGKTWKPVMAGLIDDSDIMSLRVDATDPARVYLSACSGIYRSENRGEQWFKLQGIPYSARRTQTIVQDPALSKTLYAATTEGLWVTRDGGESWERTTPREWVVNAVVVLPQSAKPPSRVIIGTEAQGVLVSEDQGIHFSAWNEGFTHRVVKQLIGSKSEPGHLLMILQRNGQEILESRDAGSHWDTLDLSANTTRGKKTLPLNSENVERVYASPRGWLLRLRTGQLWVRESGEEMWSEWKLRQPPLQKGVSRSGKGSRAVPAAKELRVLQGPWSFDQNNIYVGTAQGLMRCASTGIASCYPRLPTTQIGTQSLPMGRAIEFMLLQQASSLSRRMPEGPQLGVICPAVYTK